jgi:hypothetical protein
MTLKEALARIKELEEENSQLKAELEEYRGKKFAGRQKHDATWMESYRDFEVKFGNGMSIMEIVAEGRISRRTAYRYKAYYDELTKLSQAQKSNADDKMV